MKNTIKIVFSVTGLVISSAALGATGLDRSVFTPNFLFEKGNYAELTLSRSEPTLSPTFAPSANISENVNTLNLAYKHQINDQLGLGFTANTQPIGVDVDYASLNNTLRGSVSSKSYTALVNYQTMDQLPIPLNVYGGIKYQTANGSANLTSLDPTVPGATTFHDDSDMGYILGAAYSIPEIAFRASLTYESALAFNLDTTFQHPVAGQTSIGTTKAGTPQTVTLELQSGIAKDTLLFGSIRSAKWADAQVLFLGSTPLSSFENTMDYTLGVGRKFNDAISGSVTLSYEPSTGEPSSPFSSQDGEQGIAFGVKYTAQDGLITSAGIQQRWLGDTVTTASSGSIPFTDNEVFSLGVKLAKSF